jgi:cell division protein FtsB
LKSAKSRLPWRRELRNFRQNLTNCDETTNQSLPQQILFVRRGIRRVNDLFSQYQYYQQLHKLKQERDFYQKETAKVTEELNELSSDPKALEKFAREKYLMKKDNEDVFVIQQPKKDDQ